LSLDPIARASADGDRPETGQSDPPSIREASSLRTGEEVPLREMERVRTEERLERELPVILGETRVTPRVEQGELRGLRITHLPGGTLLSEFGLRVGDVLMSVNEQPVESLGALNGLYADLLKEREIRIVIEREGRIVELATELR
jgi:type II secretory pathway component PulC